MLWECFAGFWVTNFNEHHRGATVTLRKRYKYSNDSDSPHRRSRIDRSVVFATWRQCAWLFGVTRVCPEDMSLVLAKFHYTDPTGPARTQRSFAAKKSVRVRSGPCRVRVVEFSYYWSRASASRSRSVAGLQCVRCSSRNPLQFSSVQFVRWEHGLTLYCTVSSSVVCAVALTNTHGRIDCVHNKLVDQWSSAVFCRWFSRPEQLARHQAQSTQSVTNKRLSRRDSIHHHSDCSQCTSENDETQVL